MCFRSSLVEIQNRILLLNRPATIGLLKYLFKSTILTSNNTKQAKFQKYPSLSTTTFITRAHFI